MGVTVSFYDPDGVGTACAVRFHLLRSQLEALERGRDIVEFDSNTGTVSTEPGTGRSTGHAAVPEAIDFRTSYYWVQVELVRNSTACNPVAVGVHLVHFIL